MQVLYKSTRSDQAPIKASQAVLKGLSDDGGLYVPDHIPAFDHTMGEFAAMDYRETAYQVMKLLLSDYTEEELRYCIDQAYDSKFDIPTMTALHETSHAYYMELFHGPTLAFKDMALSILPYLLTTAARKNGMEKEIVILTATSGDTGKAALAGFADVPGTRIMVFYPREGVSTIQERQMVTQKGANTKVVGIWGNFDDAQTSVKQIFTDEGLRAEMDEKGFCFSSANSINIGRLVPQIVYYVFAYAELLRQGKIKEGDQVNFAVPTGNFGNILAAYYAMRMGLPVGRLVCASNSNKVLFDFFKTGCYDRRRDFVLTTSPSMDILISSNLERLLYHISGDDYRTTARLMEQLTEDGSYEITPQMREALELFRGGYAEDRDTAERIHQVFERDGYVLDPHTAVASYVYNLYVEKTGDTTPAVIDFTASPYKFERAVMSALGQSSDLPDLDLADQLCRVSGIPVPAAISGLRTARTMHRTVCDREDMEKEVRDFLGL